MMEKVKNKGVNLLLLVDVVMVDYFVLDVILIVIEDVNVKEDYMGLDMGFKIIVNFVKIIKELKIVVWNGLMGVFEFENFVNGILLVVRVMVELIDVIIVIGGGDSVVVVN